MCAIAGAFNVPNAAYTVQLMLKAMQHRGQQAAGILSCDQGKFFEHKALGLVDEVFGKVDVSQKLPGRMAIGHTRYSTTGSTDALSSVQPLWTRHRGRSMAVAHNGNLTDYPQHRALIEEQGSLFLSDSDSELFLHLLARSREPDFDARLQDAMQKPHGAWALLVMTEDALYATADPHGMRPLVKADYQGGTIFASETCAFDLLDVEPKSRLQHGETIKVSNAGVTRARLPNLPAFSRACSFEHTYFSRPDSVAFDTSCDEVREKVGFMLADKSPVDADIVISVPDSANPIAEAYAFRLGIRYPHGLIKNHYSGRTFTTPTQIARELGVRMKLNPVTRRILGKRIVVVDDSLVRGTTAKKVVALLRKRGATEVHFRFGTPRVVHPCHWGIDTPSHSDLRAAQGDDEYVRRYIGADSVAFISVEDFMVTLGDETQQKYCLTCYTGIQPHEPFVPASALVRRGTV